MKLLNSTIVMLLLLNVGCSNEANQPEPTKPAAVQAEKAEPITVYSSTDALFKSKDNAEKALEAAKQVNQTILDSAAQQQEAIEKAQQ